MENTTSKSENYINTIKSYFEQNQTNQIKSDTIQSVKSYLKFYKQRAFLIYFSLFFIVCYFIGLPLSIKFNLISDSFVLNYANLITFIPFFFLYFSVILCILFSFKVDRKHIVIHSFKLISINDINKNFKNKRDRELIISLKNRFHY